MSDGTCRERAVSKVVSTLNQRFQPRNTADMVALFTTTIIDVVEATAPAPPRRQGKREWNESAETSAAFEMA